MPTTLEFIKLGFAVFAAMLGATYQLSSNSGQPKQHSVFQKIISFLTAVFLTALLEALLLFNGKVNWLWVAVFGLIFSLAAEHLVRPAMNYQQGAKSILDYLRRAKKVNDLINSGKLDLDDDDSTEKHKNDQTP